ncbi:thiamine pyrophosphate-dependent enzyme [Muricauda sp. 2012CJ35-5]|uniref:Thiamine pyrophosphate-dependent enzyme n=1 Tax=Flagellimonas spongiicola TaxID=2942208 RepID=A0ABT0PQE7_9FLAO|nr:thiamine pyrophosphate-dependent enzyme [Allomuricauda spongiicola]MCL6272917.1 thiamine pyrophosphate-dependent enzyme [Allomuricauda spongiicola]
MKKQELVVLTGNQAAAHIAYKVNEVCAIYPITPSSEMSELVELWSAEGRENIFGDIPSIFEMQGEGGVAGAMHGALQTGAFSTTFTASQGLLLMLPNMYKIAGELTPNVIHVATRTIATHALSVFGDHSDIMAVRNSGYAFLGAASVQETMDFALIAQAATLESRIPFVHFFDGFRTSHETSKIEKINDQVISAMISKDMVNAHAQRALNPNNPVIRGTSQGPDVYFQAREAINQYYDACPTIVQRQMDKFAALTGRQYRLFDYVGHPEAEYILIAMGSATQTMEDTVLNLNTEGAKVGLVKVRLFRPFSMEGLINSIPESCKAIAVLDRTKEPGGTGEPLYLDVCQAFMTTGKTKFESLPKIVGGRYGLSSKEFTPAMVNAVVENLKTFEPKNNFTVGIEDDITGLSLTIDSDFSLRSTAYQAIFYQTKKGNTLHDFENSLKLLGNETHHFVQGYTECDYKKSNSRSVSHLRISENTINAPYLVSDADFAVCGSIEYVVEDSVLEQLQPSGILLVHTTLDEKAFWNSLPIHTQEKIVDKSIKLHIVDLQALDQSFTINGYVISSIHACFLALTDFLPKNLFPVQLKSQILEVEPLFDLGNKTINKLDETQQATTLLDMLLQGRGHEVPTSLLPVDGTFESGTSDRNKRNRSLPIPIWDTDLCTQCGACSMACAQAAIRTKAYEKGVSNDGPELFKAIQFEDTIDDFDLLDYTVQVNPEQCTSCYNCVDACPAKALTMSSSIQKKEIEQTNWEFFTTIPELDRTKLDVLNVAQQQLQEPLFKYSMGVDGCGEAPYLKLLSQLFGDRMLVANATGASSIFGGGLPTTPWAKNEKGSGPAWSNSLFEDNAEFGLGYRLSLDHKEEKAKRLLLELSEYLDESLVEEISNATQNSEAEIDTQRKRVRELNAQLCELKLESAAKLLETSEHLVKKSVWIVGGDGWAYDIGFGGLDHVLASGKNVNILVMDNEVYSNTGGQMSKATPFAATAKFAAKGKQKQKKDLGLLAMGYSDVYVASVAIGASQEQTLKAFVEAEKHDGPSLIIAYCHSPAHGIDMSRPSQYHQAAVASGQWLLYRNDPKRQEMRLKSLQLDSKRPTIPIEDYLKMEGRFVRCFGNDQSIEYELIRSMQFMVDSRFEFYKGLEYKKAGKPARITEMEYIQ